MNRQLTILFDYDDVLFPLIPLWVETLNKLHNLSITPERITEWDISKFYPTLTKEQIFEPLESNDFWSNIKPVKDGHSSLFKLIKAGHKIKVATATHYKNVKPKMEQLFLHYPFIVWEDVYITSDKQSILADILVDDAPHNLENGIFEKILITQPHNQSYNAKSNGMYRVDSLTEACYIIEQLSHIYNKVSV